jgi:hypothetical protein
MTWYKDLFDKIHSLTSQRHFTIDELIEMLKGAVESPIPYNVQGRYAFHGAENEFSGLFYIGNDKRIAGEIKDPNSMCKKHAVAGEISFTDGVTTMAFVKMPMGMLSNVYYYLHKIDSPKKTMGNYEGEWSFAELVIKTNLKEYETETKNKTRITLKPKQHTKTLDAFLQH